MVLVLDRNFGLRFMAQPQQKLGSTVTTNIALDLLPGVKASRTTPAISVSQRQHGSLVFRAELG